jgi:hypothetical protein
MTSLTKVLIGGVIGTVLTVSIVFNFYQRVILSQERDARKQVENNNYELSIERDSVLAANDSLEIVLSKYQYVIDSLDVLIDGNERQITYLNNELTKAEDEIINTLNNDGIDEYVLSEEEKTDCELNRVRVNYLDSISEHQRVMIVRQHNQLVVKDDMIRTLRKDNEAKEVLLESLYRDLANLTEQNAITEQDLRDAKRALRLWKAGSITAGAAIVALLIIL